MLPESFIRQSAVVVVSLFILSAGCTPTATPGSDQTSLGQGVDLDVGTAQLATGILADIDSMTPGENAKIVGALQPQTGPVGTFAGIALDDGNRVFLLGEVEADDTISATGVVLEDADGNLILMQETEGLTTRITYATGDVVALDAGGPGLRLTYTLNGTVPPSTFVVDIDDNGIASVDESALAISSIENPNYNVGRIRLERGAENGLTSRRVRANLSEDCPFIQGTQRVVEVFCAVWGLVTSKAPKAAITASCSASQAFLDGLRGSDPLPPLPEGPEFAPRVIGIMKLGIEVLCKGIEAGWDAAQLLKNIASVPDLACLGYSFVNEGSRLVTDDARNIAQVICDSVTPPAVGLGCSNTCVTANNGRCEDGGPLSVDNTCRIATDCNDCSRRDVPGCSNTCATARNGTCEEGTGCAPGTDCEDCANPVPTNECNDSCEAAADGLCDDGGPGSDTAFCAFGTDCTDCGPRDEGDAPEEPEPEDCSDDGLCNTNCPDFEPDPNCTNAELCAAKGFCCPEDSTCDVRSCNSLDPDCTNAVVCDIFGFCCDDNDICEGSSSGLECPTPDTDCALCATVDDVCIEDCDPPDPDCPPEGFGSVTGTVVNAQTGDPLNGATVIILTSTLTTTTDAAGRFTLNDVPAGPQVLVATFEDFADNSAPIVVPVDGTIEQSVGLLALSDSDLVAAVLSWGADPNDLDIHMSGPDGNGGRFHVYFSNRNPVSFACLDLDDVTSFGPETITVTSTDEGQLVSGVYSIWVHNFSGSPEFGASNATLSLFVNSIQVEQWNVGGGGGEADIWRVAEFTVEADGTVSSIDSIQSFTDGGSSSVF